MPPRANQRDEHLIPQTRALVEGCHELAMKLAWDFWRSQGGANGSSHDFSDLISVATWELVDAGLRWRPYCLTPNTPVLTADLRWVPIGELKEGQELVGVEEFVSGAPQLGRTFVRSEVLKTERREAPCVKITFDDGRSVVCTSDHRWLGLGLSKTTYRWFRTCELEIGHRISSPLRVWEEDRTFEGGWLSGIIDGEGHIVSGDTPSSNYDGSRSVCIAQNQGIVNDQIKQVLDDMDLPYQTLLKSGSDKCERITIAHKRYAIELLGRLRPYRFDASRLWEGTSIRGKNIPANATIVSIEDVGIQEVITLETSSRTFLANGLVSHNCEENNYSPESTEYFASFAARTIKGGLLDYARREDYVPRAVRDEAREIRRLLDQGMSREQVCAQLSIPLAKLNTTMAAVAARPRSMQEIAEGLNGAGSGELEDPSRRTIESEADANYLLDAFVEIIERMPYNKQAVLALRYYAQVDMEDIARYLNTTLPVLWRIHSEILTEIREKMQNTARAS